MSTLPEKSLQLRSLIKPEGELELSLVEVDMPTPGPGDVIIKVEATPINPSDLGLLVGAGDIRTAVQSGTAERPVITAKVPEAGMSVSLWASAMKALALLSPQGSPMRLRPCSASASRALVGSSTPNTAC